MALNELSGRKGNYRWSYGTHGWVPERQFDFSRGFIRDIVPTDLPPGSLYDVQDYLVHMQGALVMRGGTAYDSPAMTAATYAKAVAYAEYPAGGQLVGVGDNGHIYKCVTGTTTDLGGSTVTTVDTPKFRIGGTKNLLVFPVSDGTSGPVKYDGTAAPANLGGAPAAGKYCAVYKSRLALGGSSSTPQRVYFSPTPDIESTWDTTNSWVDFDHPITGMCALQNALLVFSAGHTERLIGSTPPPNSDMDRQPVGDIGCLDARSIAVWKGNCIFADSSGVYLTNGSEIESLTGGAHGNDGIADYWQRSIMPFFTAGSTVLAGGVYRDFYFVSLQGKATLLCHLPTRAWTIINFPTSPLMYASKVGGTEELYFADAGQNRIVQLSGLFVNSSDVDGTGADADGTAIAPSFITKSFGSGASNIAFGHAHITALVRDLSAPAGGQITVYRREFILNTETSIGFLPFSVYASLAIERSRFSLNMDAPATALRVQQAGKTAGTIIRGIEIDMRGYPNTAEGPTV